MTALKLRRNDVEGIFVGGGEDVVGDKRRFNMSKTGAGVSNGSLAIEADALDVDLFKHRA